MGHVGMGLRVAMLTLDAGLDETERLGLVVLGGVLGGGKRDLLGVLGAAGTFAAGAREFGGVVTDGLRRVFETSKGRE